MTDEIDSHNLVQRVNAIASTNGLNIVDKTAVMTKLETLIPFPKFTSDAFLVETLRQLTETSSELFASPVKPSQSDEFKVWAATNARDLATASPQRKLDIANAFAAYEGTKGQPTAAEMHIRGLMARCGGDTSKLSALDRMRLADLQGVPRPRSPYYYANGQKS